MKTKNKFKKNIFNFLNKPFSKQSLDTLKILNKLRSVKTKGKFCLICIKKFKVWQLAEMSGERGKPAKPLNKYFNNLEEAEKFVFNLRFKNINNINK